MAIDVRSMTPLLYVFDMPTSMRFYCDVLGFKVHHTAGSEPDCDWAALALNGVEVMLNALYERLERPISADDLRIAAHNDTCLYFNCADVDGAYAHLRAKGIGVKQPEAAYYGMKQLYLTDPDGYALCFQCPAFSK